MFELFTFFLIGSFVALPCSAMLCLVALWPCLRS